jgi:hypothetical protein
MIEIFKFNKLSLKEYWTACPKNKMCQETKLQLFKLSKNNSTGKLNMSWEKALVSAILKHKMIF